MNDRPCIFLLPSCVVLRWIPSLLSEFSSRSDTFFSHLRDLSCSPDTGIPRPALARLYDECAELFTFFTRMDTIARKTGNAVATCLASVLLEICSQNRDEIDQLSNSSPEDARASLRNFLDNDAAEVRAVLDWVQDQIKDLWGDPAPDPV